MPALAKRVGDLVNEPELAEGLRRASFIRCNGGSIGRRMDRTRGQTRFAGNWHWIGRPAPEARQWICIDRKTPSAAPNST